MVDTMSKPTLHVRRLAGVRGCAQSGALEQDFNGTHHTNAGGMCSHVSGNAGLL